MIDLIEEKTHARLSPSSAKRWMTCPGSVQLIEKLGIKDKTSKYAAEGSVAHRIHELCLVKNKQAKDYLGCSIEVNGMTFKINQDMVKAVQLSLDYIVDKILWAEFEGLRVEIQIEVRSSLKYLDIPGLDGGTSDVVILFWNDDKDLVAIEVYDYKHGAGLAVEAINNPQAMCYALGIVEKYKASPETKIEITIGQPRVYHLNGFIRTWTIKANALKTWQDATLVPAAKATHKKDARLVPSDNGCRFCGAAGCCPKLFEHTQKVAMMDFNKPEPQLPNVLELSADQKRFVIDHADMLRSFIIAVENQVKLEVDQGSKEYEDYYKLVRKTTRRKLRDNAIDKQSSPLFEYLKHEDVFEEKSRPLSEIERRLKNAIGAERSKEIMANITTKPEGELVIAPITDKRKAQEPTMISDFTALEN